MAALRIETIYQIVIETLMDSDLTKVQQKVEAANLLFGIENVRLVLAGGYDLANAEAPKGEIPRFMGQRPISAIDLKDGIKIVLNHKHYGKYGYVKPSGFNNDYARVQIIIDLPNSH